MGIYQRDLTTYEQTPIAENRNFGKQCINCHTFNRNSPDTMMVHVRGKQGGTLISLNGEMEKSTLSLKNTGMEPLILPGILPADILHFLPMRYSSSSIPQDKSP